MARACKLIGGTLAIAGIAVAVWFAGVIARDAAYHQAALAASLHPGNVMYDAELKGAQIRRGFELFGAIAGVLLAVNGGTLVTLGMVAQRRR